MTVLGRRVTLVWMLVLAWGCATPASPTEIASPGAGAGGGAAGIAASIVDLTNSERSTAGLAALRANALLMQAAQLQAEQMARLGRLEHELPGAQYPKPSDRLAAVGYNWRQYAENIAMGQANAVAALDAWMHSSGHRANILNGSLRELGVGYAIDSNGRPYYVQVFGSPMS